MKDTYKHASGLEFDLGYVNGHDITIIMLYTMIGDVGDEPEIVIVDYICGTRDYITDDDICFYIDKWLDKQTADYIQQLTERHQAFMATM